MANFMTKTQEEMTGSDIVVMAAVTGVTLTVAPYAFLALMGGTLIAYDKIKKSYRDRFPKK